MANRSEAGTKVGYLVLVFEHGTWTDSWDGTVHQLRSSAEPSLALCRADGWACTLAELTLVEAFDYGAVVR